MDFAALAEQLFGQATDILNQLIAYLQGEEFAAIIDQIVAFITGLFA